VKVKELIERLKKFNSESEAVLDEWELVEHTHFVRIQKIRDIRPIHVLFPEKPHTREDCNVPVWDGHELSDSAFMQSFDDEEHAVECVLIEF
jgi:hypothetical protein